MNDISNSTVDCGDCAYWDESQNNEGFCRKYAPRAFASEQEYGVHWGIWPRTVKYDRCAEGVLKENLK